MKNRKPDSVGRSSRSGRSIAPPQPAVSAAVSDIEMVRERIRGWIALAVITLLALIVLSGVIGLVSGKLSVNDVKELVASQTALITLVGTAMGFYFGRTMR